MVDQDEFLIQELADKAGVSLRTIRYYTQEGLLPEPASRGKYAYYNQEHLDRLLLILRLKDTYLPLKEIRQLLVSLSWPEVRDLLQSKDRPNQTQEVRTPVKPQQTAANTDSALDYIHRLLQTGSEQRAADSTRTGLDRPSSPPKPFDHLTMVPPESWRRFILAPGVELHIKEPSTAADRQRLEELIQFARRLYSRDKK